jgi:hypothetical protein
LSITDYDEIGGHGDLLVYRTGGSPCNEGAINNYNIVVNAYDANTDELLATASRYNYTTEVGADWQWYTSTVARDVYITYNIYGDMTGGGTFSISDSLGTVACS